MSKQKSAGIWLYVNKIDSVLLIHPTDRSSPNVVRLLSWSLPKGRIEASDYYFAALREFEEEVGLDISSSGEPIPMAPFTLDSGKVVYSFLVVVNTLDDIGLSSADVPEGNLDIDEVNAARFIPVSGVLKYLDHRYIEGWLNVKKWIRSKRFNNK